MMKSIVAETLRYLDLPGEVKDFVEFSQVENSILARVNQKVAAGESLAAIMDFLFDETRAIMPCDRIGLAFVEEEGARISSHWVRANYEPILLGKGYAEDVQGSSLGEVIKNGAPRIINDLAAYLDAKPESRSTRILVKEGVRSSMTCPLMVAGRVVGVMFRSSRQPNAYDERLVSLHLATAERLSQAVEKAYRIEQLMAAKQAYMEMLAFVSHELKNPLASLIMDAQVLTGGFTGDLNPKQTASVKRMQGKAEFLNQLVRDYLDLAHIEGGDIELKPQENVDMAASILEPAIDLTKPQLDAKGSNLEREYSADPVLVTCDQHLMQIVANNLISNAVKYGNDGGRIKITLRRDTDKVAFSVWNEGPGFPESERGRLFRKFSRLPTPELFRRKGSGVGLYTSWRIVQMHGGRMWATSEYGKWAEFGCEIPRLQASEERE